jgi:hypothetical protein
MNGNRQRSVSWEEQITNGSCEVNQTFVNPSALLSTCFETRCVDSSALGFTKVWFTSYDLTNGINLVERKNAESKKCRKKNIESATNATSMNPFTKTA